MPLSLLVIGLIGYAYTSGIQAAWLMGGWVFGDMLSWLWVAEPPSRGTKDEKIGPG